MINGDVNEFVENLYYGSEMNFAYADKQYFIEGSTEDGITSLELYQTVPVTTNEGYCVWKDSSNNPQERVNNLTMLKYLTVKVFGKWNRKLIGYMIGRLMISKNLKCII